MSSILEFYALHSLQRNSNAAAKAMWNALSYIDAESPTELGLICIPLVVANVSLLFQIVEEPSNGLKNDPGENKKAQLSTPPTSGILSSGTTSKDSDHYIFCYATFNCLLEHQKDLQSIREVLPAILVLLVWLRSLCRKEVHASNDPSIDTQNLLLTGAGFHWSGLCDFLNEMTKHELISDRMAECENREISPFPFATGHPQTLPEDISMYGLEWARGYFRDTGLDIQNTDERVAIEAPSVHKNRATRIYWLALI